MTARVFVALAALTAWLLALFLGYRLGGAAHLLFVAALVVFPWRALPRG